MTHHYWGDEWEHWVDLNDAMVFIQDEFNEKSGLNISMKEKYGTLRYEHILWEQDGRWNFDDTVDNWKLLYEVVKEAVRKYPQIEDEILTDLASHDEVVGKEVHDKYWITL